MYAFVTQSGTKIHAIRVDLKASTGGLPDRVMVNPQMSKLTLSRMER